MAQILFMDSFGHYTSPAQKWTAADGVSIAPGAGRWGGAALSGAIGFTAQAVKGIAARASAGMGFALNASLLSPGSDLVRFIDGATTQCGLRLGADGSLYLHRAGTVLATSAAGIASAGGWVHVECMATIGAAGSISVRVNGTSVAATFSGNTQTTGAAQVTAVALGGSAGSSPQPSVFVSDCYISDGTGWVGDVRIDMLQPNADGSYSAFTTSSGTAHAALVDEASPDLTDYVQSATVNARDSYQLTDLASGSSAVQAVQVLALASKTGTDARSAAVFLRSGSTNADGAGAALSTDPAYVSAVFNTAPGGGALSDSIVNAAEAGVVVTA